ncbi:MAG: hypothetical protein ACTSW4_04865, partial [Candidatus Ranarchaeia archaeon]
MERESVEKSLVPLAEVRRILEERQKGGELNYIQRITLEHAQRFTKTTPKKAYALIDILGTEFNINGSLAVQIVNLMPKYLEEIRVFFAGQKIATLPRSDEELVLILKTLMEFAFSSIIEERHGL